ncbi:MAG: ammonium transporter [Clostridia bacterium]|nr:ammonium transporter [Clostridia bacterium]
MTVEALQGNLDILWVLIAAILVFLMQAGFALVETGFTRAKNANNIIMKNLMDFSIGTPIFFLVGFGLMFGAGGFMGTEGFLNPIALADQIAFDVMGIEGAGWVYLFFQTVFAATAATIVSGAMAERTKFISYVIYSAVISLFIYPVVGHWIWGGGWLAQIGFHDFAGSTVVHSVGGWAALVGAATLGPRIGKYGKDKKVNAIPGHNIVLGALGVFLLWVGWFGFNPGSTLSVNADIGYIAVTTNLAAAMGAIVTMILTWIRYGKPDVSMTLNGVLAGLVAITAGCDAVDAYGAMIIGVVAGFVVTFGVEFLDKVVKIDDPVGAVGVHCMNGVWGTLAVGLFATNGGLFYGGGLQYLGSQALGVITVAAWTVVTTGILFNAIKHTVGLRVSREEELMGLDKCEHGSEAYADFVAKL